MGIFDEAIREHLELKRQHGAAEPELAELEGEAFGPAARPGETAVADPGADEAPTTVQPAETEEPSEPLPGAEPPGEADEPLPEPAETSSVRAETEEHPPPEGVVESEVPSLEAVPEPPADAEGGSIADQPTEFYDVEGAPGAAETGEAEVEDEFFSEQSLSDELDQALDAPDTAPEPGPAPDPGEVPDPGEPPPGDDEPLPSEEAPAEGVVAEEGEEGEDGEDVLEETPEFLQDTPEHDRLWFEQKPPKDFDFDD